MADPASTGILDDLSLDGLELSLAISKLALRSRQTKLFTVAKLLRISPLGRNLVVGR